MHGLHLTADLHNCRCERHWLEDAAALSEWCLQTVQGCGLSTSAQLFQQFPHTGGGAGISAALLLPGSHISLHTWPARKAVLLDVCLSSDIEGHAALAPRLMQALAARFAPEWTEQRSLDRGDDA